MTPEPIATTPAITSGRASHTERQSSSWDIKNAPRNYFSLVAFQVGSAVFAFGSVWLITRFLGAEGYGGIVAVIAASQVAQVLVQWTSLSVVRFGVDEFVENASIARTFWTRFIILGVNLAIVLATAVLWFPPLADWLRLSPDKFWLIVLHFGVTALWLHVQMGLQGAKMLREQGFLQMSERLIILTGILALIASGHLTFYWAVMCYIAGPALMVLAGLFRLRELVFARFSLNTAVFRKLIIFSLPLLPFTLIGYFSGSYVDAVFISKFLSTSDLGVYSVATQINGMAMQMPMLANTILLPLFITLRAESGDQRSFEYFRNVLPGLTLVWGIGCTFLAFLGYFAIPMVFGAEFQPATIPLWILLAAATVGIPVAIGYSALSNATSKTYIAMVAAILSASANVVANFILIPQYGLAGCAFATLIAFFVGVTVFAILLKRDAGMPISWSYAAFVPCIAGTILFCWQRNAPLGLAVCLGASMLVGYWFRSSLLKTVSFVKGLRGTPV